MVRILSVITTCLLLAISVLAYTDTSTQIFDPRFRTLKTSVEGNFMSAPVIRMNTRDRIVINFDEIGEDYSFLEYRLIHCNADWQPSQLIDSEFVDSFNSQKIEDYAYSVSTFVHYVNYQIVLPNNDMRILHSGNYLLQVYDPDDPDETLLQTRFQVSEAKADVAGCVTSRTDRGHNGEWQQISFSVGCEGMGNFNAYQDIMVDVSQNMREESRRRLVKPYMVNSRAINYEHMPELIFPASNEYRRFESVSNSFPGMHVDSLRYSGRNYHVWLKPDSPRRHAEYSYDRTQHGRYLVREYNSSDSNLGADYITVHFLLEMQEIPDTEVYVEGEFTNGRYDSFNRMHYNRELGAYTAEITLKQGAYNYQYVTRRAGSKGLPTPYAIEGNKYETDNEYDITVYFRPPGERADRIVGAGKLEM